MQRRYILHVLVLHNVLIVHQDFRVSGKAIASVMMNVQLFVVVSVVTARPPPGREGPLLSLWPGVVRVVQGEGWHPCSVQVERVESVAVQLQFGLAGVTETCQ